MIPCSPICLPLLNMFRYLSLPLTLCLVLLLAACMHEKEADEAKQAMEKEPTEKQVIEFPRGDDNEAMEKDEVTNEEAEEGEDIANFFEDVIGDQDDTEPEAMMEEEEAMAEEEVAAPTGVYMAYVDGVIGNGETSVLFFHAAWCPKCIANDAKLNSWYTSQDFPRSIYRVDYDTAVELKKQYGVVQQDTFVLIDGNGAKIDAASFPTDARLQGLLGA